MFSIFDLSIDMTKLPHFLQHIYDNCVAVHHLEASDMLCNADRFLSITRPNIK